MADSPKTPRYIVETLKTGERGRERFKKMIAIIKIKEHDKTQEKFTQKANPAERGGGYYLKAFHI